MQLQVKILIGTIAFMLTMIILGFAALREPARLEAFAQAQVARSIESGAQLYISNCVECHGVEGRAENCVNAAGEAVPCQGRPLNSRALLCGQPSQRMEALDWAGTKEGLLESTIATGRPWAGMPTWGQEFGGPLQASDIGHLTQYILNWGSEEFCDVPVFEFPWPETFEEFINLAELPEDAQQAAQDNSISIILPLDYPGDAENGEELFNLTYGCAACHGNPEDPSTAIGPGPHLAGISEEGADRIEGYSAEMYVYESILHPAEFLAPACPTADGTCANAMPDNFDLRMSPSPQDLLDIMTYLWDF
jgi:mono/diheme cytochrome c family protein